MARSGAAYKGLRAASEETSKHVRTMIKEYGAKFVARELGMPVDRVRRLAETEAQRKKAGHATPRISYSDRNRINASYRNDWNAFEALLVEKHQRQAARGYDDYDRPVIPTSDFMHWLRKFRAAKKALDSSSESGKNLKPRDYRDLVGYMHAMGFRTRSISWPGSN